MLELLYDLKIKYFIQFEIQRSHDRKTKDKKYENFHAFRFETHQMPINY